MWVEVEEPCVGVQLQSCRVHTAWHACPFLPRGYAMEAHTSQTYTGSAEDELKKAPKIGTVAFPCFVLKKSPKPCAAPLRPVGCAFTN